MDDQATEDLLTEMFERIADVIERTRRGIPFAGDGSRLHTSQEARAATQRIGWLIDEYAPKVKGMK